MWQSCREMEQEHLLQQVNIGTLLLMVVLSYHGLKINKQSKNKLKIHFIVFARSLLSA